MMFSTRSLFFIGWMGAALNASAANYTDTQLGFSAELPTHWIVEAKNDTERVFYDTTGALHGIAGLRYISIEASFAGDSQWVESTMEAYRIFAETELLGIVYSVTDITQDGLFAKQAAAEYGYPTYSEIVRYTAFSGRGYELYVLSDSTDMRNKYSQYVSFLDSFQILKEVLSAKNPSQNKIRQDDARMILFDKAQFRHSPYPLYSIDGKTSPSSVPSFNTPRIMILDGPPPRRY